MNSNNSFSEKEHQISPKESSANAYHQEAENSSNQLSYPAPPLQLKTNPIQKQERSRTSSQDTTDLHTYSEPPTLSELWEETRQLRELATTVFNIYSFLFPDHDRIQDPYTFDSTVEYAESLSGFINNINNIAEELENWARGRQSVSRFAPQESGVRGLIGNTTEQISLILNSVRLISQLSNHETLNNYRRNPRSRVAAESWGRHVCLIFSTASNLIPDSMPGATYFRILFNLPTLSLDFFLTILNRRIERISQISGTSDSTISVSEGDRTVWHGHLSSVYAAALSYIPSPQDGINLAQYMNNNRIVRGVNLEEVNSESIGIDWLINLISRDENLHQETKNRWIIQLRQRRDGR